MNTHICTQTIEDAKVCLADYYLKKAEDQLNK
jgi:hypothetical protein